MNPIRESYLRWIDCSVETLKEMEKNYKEGSEEWQALFFAERVLSGLKTSEED